MLFCPHHLARGTEDVVVVVVVVVVEAWRLELTRRSP